MPQRCIISIICSIEILSDIDTYMTEKNIAEQIVDELLKEKKDLESGQKKDGAVQPPVQKVAKPKIDPKVKSPPIKDKHYYDVKVECMLPAVLTFRVLAEDPIQAGSLIKGMSPVGVKHRLLGRKDIKLSVYDAGSSMLKWMKNLLGG